jgi:acetyl esterase/lipase
MSWGAWSQEERDAAYNNSAAVADSQRLVRERNEESAAFRAAHAGRLDLTYGDGERTKWDIYPASDAGAPCLVFIHGGYWQMNRREDFAVFAEGFLANGWSVAMPGYSLAPDASLTGIATELRAALDWLAAHGPEHGVSGGRIVLAGWSAGGHLAALLLDHPSVQAGLAISGIFELGPLRDTYLNAKLKLTEAEIAQLSPLRLPVVQKPLAIAYGSRELPALVDDSREFHARRAAAHAAGALIPVAGADHFTVLRALRDSRGELVRAARDLLEA